MPIFFSCFVLQVLIGCGVAVWFVFGKGEGKMGRDEGTRHSQLAEVNLVLPERISLRYSG